MNLIFRYLFFVHDIAGVDHSVTLQKVTSISQDEVQALLLDFPVCEDVDWGFTDAEKTQSISKTPYELNMLEKVKMLNSIFLIILNLIINHLLNYFQKLMVIVEYLSVKHFMHIFTMILK